MRLHLRRQYARRIEIAVPLMVPLPAIVVQTIFQLEVGMEFEMAEIVGLIGGFLVPGAIALYLFGHVLMCEKDDIR